MSFVEPMEYVVLGASGWLGRATLEHLFSTLPAAEHGRVHAYASQHRVVALRDGVSVVAKPLAELSRLLLRQPALMFHYAFQTKDKVASSPVAEYVRANQAIREQLVAFAASNSLAGLLAPSSGAVYAGLDAADVSDLAIYGRCKLDDERAFKALAETHGFPVCSPRVFNLSGPYINKHGMYAIASIISACLQRQAITLQAAQPVVRSYYPVMSLIALACKVLGADRGQGGMWRTFDTAGHEVVELGALAQRCRQLLAPGCVIKRPPPATVPANHYVGDATTLRALEQQHGMHCPPLDTQIQDTASYLQSALAGV